MVILHHIILACYRVFHLCEMTTDADSATANNHESNRQNKHAPKAITMTSATVHGGVRNTPYPYL